MKSSESGNVFSLADESHKNLFVVGNGDITIMKKNNFKHNTCVRSSFEYGGPNRKLLVYETKNEEFKLKRLRVVQMK